MVPAGPASRLTWTLSVPLIVSALVAVRSVAAVGSAENEVLLPKVIDLAVPRPWRFAPAETVRSEPGMLPARLNVPALTRVAPV